MFFFRLESIQRITFEWTTVVVGGCSRRKNERGHVVTITSASGYDVLPSVEVKALIKERLRPPVE